MAKYKVVFKEKGIIVFDTIEMTDEQAKKFKALPECLSIEKILSEMNENNKKEGEK